MIAKHWKKIGFIILIVACLFNIVNKLVRKTSVQDELQQSADYMQEQRMQENEQ